MNYAIVLATEVGTQMKVEMPKCAFPLLKKPMIEYVVDVVEKTAIDKIICVVGPKKETIEEILKDRVQYVFQQFSVDKEGSTEGAISNIQDNGYTIIIPGNLPLIDESIINQLLLTHQNEQNDFTIGTIILNPNEELKRGNTGVYCISNAYLNMNLIHKFNEVEVFYLADLVHFALEKLKLGIVTFTKPDKLKKVNDLYTLSCIEDSLRTEILKKHYENGVYIMNPQSTTICSDVVIEEGTIIYPGCNLFGKTKIGKNCSIGPSSTLENCIIEDDVVCNQSVVSDSKICKGATVGPFARIRMNSVIGQGDRIGNFVEVKNSSLGSKTNVAHLTYIGDTTCGDYVNWGCGCVTVNYDGKNKNRTTVGNNVFIGCNTNLIAPVTIANCSFIAAGSTITSSIEEGDFAIARAKQITKKGYAQKYSFKK